MKDYACNVEGTVLNYCEYTEAHAYYLSMLHSKREPSDSDNNWTRSQFSKSKANIRFTV